MNKIKLMIALLVFPGVGYAYTDPGTGMLLTQGVIAIAVMTMAFIRNPIQTIKLWLKKDDKEDGKGGK
jgi:hypothetical protein